MHKISIRRAAAAASGAALVAVLSATTLSAGASVASSPSGAVLPLPCTGSPLDSFTTCAVAAQNGQGNPGDAAGGDTPNLGGGGGAKGATL